MFGVLFLVAFATFYYRVAESERRSGLLWALVSMALFLGCWGLGVGFFLILVVQTIPFIAMLALNMMSDRW